MCRGRCGAGGGKGGGEPAPTRGCCEARESVGLDAVPSRERGMLDGDAPAPQLAAHATLVHQLPQVRRRAEQPHQLLHAGAAGCRQLGERRRSRFFLPHGAATTGGCRRALCRAGRHRNVAALLQGLPQQARQLDGELAGNLRLELRRPLAPERPQLLTQRRERILALPELPRELRLGSVQPAQQHILLPHHFFFPNSRPPGAGQGAQTASPCWRRSDIAATGRCCGLLLASMQRIALRGYRVQPAVEAGSSKLSRTLAEGRHRLLMQSCTTDIVAGELLVTARRERARLRSTSARAALLR